VTDAWCQNTTNVVPPAFAMPAHVAPLDILFYEASDWNINGGDAFVSWHGSWDRDTPQGYKVVHIEFNQGVPLKWTPFFYYASHGDVNGQTEVDKDSNWPVS
jgi:glucose/arabinose dehydrogenase